MDLGAGVFYALAAATTVAALGVVVTRNVVYSALLLILALSLTGLVYLLLLADFLALVQILIYGGTVSVLLLFALMLTRPQEGAVLNHPGWPLAALGAVILLAVLIYGAVATDWTAAAGAGTGRLATVPTRIGPEALGTALFTTWAVPFEIASLVLLVALLGALLIARTGGEAR
ncbi:MAG TPA: NADH-quinone oxidoreductase subunit J [Chloroflexota bacterium]|jgi:NADH:ubiquinone oxidoreductase subunit 6 (subunit J)|nr:NADH-quinone oxidoreductase subunit J [Chloroflexota bacterium]